MTEGTLPIYTKYMSSVPLRQRIVSCPWGVTVTTYHHIDTAWDRLGYDGDPFVTQGRGDVVLCGAGVYSRIEYYSACYSAGGPGLTTNDTVIPGTTTLDYIGSSFDNYPRPTLLPPWPRNRQERRIAAKLAPRWRSVVKRAVRLIGKTKDEYEWNGKFWDMVKIPPNSRDDHRWSGVVGKCSGQSSQTQSSRRDGRKSKSPLDCHRRSRRRGCRNAFGPRGLSTQAHQR